MRNLIILSFVVLLITATLATAVIRRVPSQYQTIQAAIDACEDGDVVLVADGRYVTATISGVTHKNKAITVQSENGPENCIIDGGGECGFWFYRTGTTACRLEGFTVTNCQYDFGAIYCSEDSSPTIVNCIVTNNGDPGGPSHYRGSAGIRCDTLSSPTISNCIIANNYFCAGYEGFGGGILCDWSCNPTVTNCTIVNNTSCNKGGAIYCKSNCHVKVNNCILWSNSTTEIDLDGVSSASVTYSNVQGGWPGDGNIDADPSFVHASIGDYHLLTNSPCIDAGDPNYVAQSDETDLDGKPRLIGAQIDMGAYELQPPRTLYVDADATGANNGSSWADAFNDLQDALAVAEAGDEIRVAQGIYKPAGYIPPPPPPFGGSNEDESIEPAVDRTATFQLINGVVIKGGYAGVGQPDPNARDIDTYKTILSGDLNGDDVEVNDPCDLLTEPSRAENSYHVVTGSDCNESAVLDGFTITAGNANSEGYPFHNGSGGGIQIRFGSMEDEGPVLTNCTFIGNSARGGGGLDNDHCNTTLTNCTFIENFADWGGGIGNEGFPVPKLVNCTFTANRAGHKGGALANAESRPTLENCTLIANHAELGGAIYNGDAGAILTNCTLIGNSAESGGAVYNSSDSSVRMTNCLVSENSCTEEGGVVYLRSEDSATLTNCILTANSAEKGGALYVGDDGYAKLTNCTVTGNWATENGGALYFDGPDDAIAKITNCILWSDTPQEIYPDLLGYEIVITYNDVQGGWPGQGNINVEPCFFDAGYWDANGLWIDGNYHLLQTSACINAGDNNSLPSDTEDLDGDGNTVEPIPFDIESNPRIAYGFVDMGAYEFFNTPPIADAGPDQVVECACNITQVTKVTLDGTNSSDPDRGVLTYTWTGPFLESPVQDAEPTVTLDGGCPGEYVITLVVNDGIDDSEPNDVLITVVDTTPPEFQFSVSPIILWPPDHKMYEITPSWTVSDECDASPDVSLVSIMANEGDDIIGGGHTTDDIQIDDDGSIFVRSERSGTDTGRIYTITYQAVDDCGNTTVRSATVGIPHDFKVLARMGERWLWRNHTGNLPEDLNGDGIVNLKDIAIFANNWIQ